MRFGHYTLCALAVAAFLLGCTKKGEEYPFEVKSAFMEACVASAHADQAAHPAARQRDDAAINRLCDCSISGIAQTVPLKDYLAYENARKLGGDPEPKTVRAISEAIAACQAQMYK